MSFCRDLWHLQIESPPQVAINSDRCLLAQRVLFNKLSVDSFMATLSIDLRQAVWLAFIAMTWGACFHLGSVLSWALVTLIGLPGSLAIQFHDQSRLLTLMWFIVQWSQTESSLRRWLISTNKAAFERIFCLYIAIRVCWAPFLRRSKSYFCAFYICIMRRVYNRSSTLLMVYAKWIMSRYLFFHKFGIITIKRAKIETVKPT